MKTYYNPKDFFQIPDNTGDGYYSFKELRNIEFVNQKTHIIKRSYEPSYIGTFALVMQGPWYDDEFFNRRWYQKIQRYIIF